jgi:serine/threonine-protein kinase PknG
MADPIVPDNKRYCPTCQAKLNHEQGFCPMCGNEYTFTPSLAPGDVVDKKYEVKGPIAFGGLGWIYLGWDMTLSRWVVLKGLLNANDAAGAAAAVAERQFLAAVKHPNIVGIYNFVSHGDAGYIVMEYVGGKTLKTIRKERGPLPMAEAMAYIHRILAAFSYLERMGLVYCDFKPDNFMVEDDDVKLIDLGGVRRVDDLDGDIYGTKGYSAAEASESPSFVSDLYTVARTLAVLIMDFSFQSKYEHSIPTPYDAPVLAQHESLYRFLLRATHVDPDQRFQSADEMADNLLGILRETVATLDEPKPFESLNFGPDKMSMEDMGADYRILPTLKLDLLDTGANTALTNAPMVGKMDDAAIQTLLRQYPDSFELPLRLASAFISLGEYKRSDELLKVVEEKDPFDWRVHWYRGVAALAQEQPDTALKSFDQVYFELPGELAPKLALAVANELSGNLNAALSFYEIVSRTNPEYTSASFGLARVHDAQNAAKDAVEAYKRIRSSSVHYTQAQVALTRTLIKFDPGHTEFEQMTEALQALTLEGLDKHSLSAEVLQAAISRIHVLSQSAPSSITILGNPVNDRALRLALERELRACAAYVKTREAKRALIDHANLQRPMTLL